MLGDGEDVLGVIPLRILPAQGVDRHQHDIVFALLQQRIRTMIDMDDAAGFVRAGSGSRRCGACGNTRECQDCGADHVSQTHTILLLAFPNG
jgi:hypothetical protein